jgi:hypothetical protein
VEYISIGKQKVVWILKCREQHKEAAGNALRLSIQNNTVKIRFFIQKHIKLCRTRHLYKSN